jgi:hypothetical protein
VPHFASLGWCGPRSRFASESFGKVATLGEAVARPIAATMAALVSTNASSIRRHVEAERLGFITNSAQR